MRVFDIVALRYLLEVMNAHDLYKCMPNYFNMGDIKVMLVALTLDLVDMLSNNTFDKLAPIPV